MTIEDRVRSLAADLIGEPAEAWDSLQHLNLVLDLEMTFGVRFTPQEMEEMTSIESAACLVTRKLG